MTSCSVLILAPTPGESAEPEGFAAELAVGGIACERAPTVRHAIERLQREPVPALIVLSEPRPGVWTDREVAAIRAAAPLARVLRVSGSWCEGQPRSGRPAAGSLGVAWHVAASRICRELAAVSAGGTLAAPLTATVEDLVLVNCRPEVRSPRSEVIAIHAPRASQADAWTAMCEGLGYPVQIYPACTRPRTGRAALHRPATAGEYRGQQETPSADVLLWDCDPRDLADAQQVRALVALARPAPVLAVCGFPRPADVETALQCGVAAVLAKPLVVADFEWQVSRLFDARRDR